MRVVRFVRLVPPCAFLLWTAFALAPSPAAAITYTVTKTADTADGACDEDCSLREAILTFDATRIEVPAGTYRIERPRENRDFNSTGNGTAGNWLVNRTLEIVGTGRDLTILDARPDAGAETEGLDRVLYVTLGGNLTLSGVTITGGRTESFSQGAGILVIGGRLAVSDSAIVGNRSAFGGGGILVSGGVPAPEVTITRCEIAGNDAGPNASGGGVYNIQSSVTIVDSWIHDNTVRIGGGAGVFNSDNQKRPNPPAVLAITGTTISHNVAGDPALLSLNEGFGAGVANVGGLATIVNSTITRNVAYPSAAPGFGPIAGTGRGGGLHHRLLLGDDPTDGTTVVNSTIAFNEAFTGSQIHGDPNVNPVRIANTLVAGEGPTCTGPSLGGVGVESLGGNLASDSASCPFTAPSDRTGVDPGLQTTLADHGGPTDTLALVVGSPAIGAADPAQCPATDQRGEPRPSPCSVGAVEAVVESCAADVAGVEAALQAVVDGLGGDVGGVLGCLGDLAAT